jgi:hypothetical protein
MDLEGNLVDRQGQSRAPMSIPDYRITDIAPAVGAYAVYGIEGAYVSGSWYYRADTEYNYASIGTVNFNNTSTNNLNIVFQPADSYNYNNGGYFKSINVIGTSTVWATGAYCSNEWNGGTFKTILGVIQGNEEPQPSLHTIGANYSGHSMWIEDSGSDADDNAYILINVYGYNQDTQSQSNAYTVLASTSPYAISSIDRWQKKITRVGDDDGGVTTHGLGLVNHDGYVYVSLYLTDNTGNDSDIALLKLDSVTGAVVWARTIGSPFDEGAWNAGEYGYGSSSDITVDPTGTYISFTANTQDQSTGTQWSNNFTIQYPLDGSLEGTFNDFSITDSTADFVVTDHDFDVVDITNSATINVLSLAVSTATLTATATAVGTGWTNFYWPLEETGPAGTTDQTWTFGQDGTLTLPGGAWDAEVGDDIQSDNSISIAGKGNNTLLTWYNTATFESLGEGDVNFSRLWLNSLGAQLTVASKIGDAGVPKHWQFNKDGTLLVPDDIQDPNGSVIRVATTSTAPTRHNGQLWFNSEEGRTYIKYNDQWVDASPTIVPAPETYLGDIAIDGDTLNINGSTLTINTSGTLLVNGSEVTGSGGGGDRLIAGTASVILGTDGMVTFPDFDGTKTLWGAVDEDFSIRTTRTDPGSDADIDIYAADDLRLYAEGDELQLYANSNVLIYTDTTNISHQWTFGQDGKLTLPSGGIISDGGAIRLEPAGASSSTQALLIYPTVIDGNHIHLTAGGGETDLYLGNDSQYVKVDNSGTIVIGTLGANTSTWTFGTDGSTKFPNDTILGTGLDPNVYIETSTTSTTSTWTFGTNGVLTLPAATPVIKGSGTGTDVTIIASTGSNTSTWVFAADGTLTLPLDTVISETASSPGLYRTKYSGTFVLDPTWFVTNAGNLIESTILPEGVIQNYEEVENAFSFQYVGYFVPPTSANYTFRAHADETFIFWIGSKALSGYTYANKDMYGDYNGTGPEQQVQSFTIALTAGQFYPIRIQWANGGGWGQLDTFTWANDAGQADTANFSGHIYTANTGTAKISVNDNKSIILSTDNETVNNWTFAADGNLSMPIWTPTSDVGPTILFPVTSVPGGSLGIVSGAVDGMALTSYSSTWTFSTSGGITFPNSGGTQTEAWNNANFTAAMLGYDGEIITNTATIGVGGLTVNGPVTFNGPFTFQSSATTQVTGNTGTFFGDVNGVGALYAGVAGYSPLPSTVFQSAANVNAYIQNNFQNLSNGTQASAEWVATANNGDDSNHYLDMGIAGSGWDGSQANSVGTAASANDSWIYAQGSTSTSAGGNLILGTIKNGKSVKILTGSTGSSSIVATFNGRNTNATTTNSGSLQVVGGVGISQNLYAGTVYSNDGYFRGPAGNGSILLASGGAVYLTGDLILNGTTNIKGPAGYTNIQLNSGWNTAVKFISTATVGGTADSTTSTTGALIVSGGAGIAKNAYVGGYVVQQALPAFRVVGTGGQISATNTLTNANFAVDFNQGNYLTTSTGVFTAPVAGIYQINLVARAYSNTGSAAQVVVQKNNSTVVVMVEWAANTTANHIGGGSAVKLAAGDTLKVVVLLGSISFDSNDNWSVAFLG